MNENIEVGDTLIVKNWAVNSSYTITRVTKTLCFSKRKKDGYEYKFKREISDNMGYPRERFNQNEYTVIRKQEK